MFVNPNCINWKPGHYVLIDALMLSLAYCSYNWYTPFSSKEHLGWFLLFWTGGSLIVFSALGTYINLYKKSRLAELSKTLLILALTSGLFSLIFHSPQIAWIKIQDFSYLFIIAFLLVWLGRWLLLNNIKKQLLSGNAYFKTLLIGNGKMADELITKNKKQLLNGGYKLIGIINTQAKQTHHFPVPILGVHNQLEKALQLHQPDQLIIALDPKENQLLSDIIITGSTYPVGIAIAPNLQHILTGFARTSNVVGAPLIEVHTGLMPEWQQNLKRIFDVVLSSSALIILSPLFLLIAIRVLCSSKGKIIYSQERIGWKGKPFRIYKFRSMIANAEPQGPQLSSDNDPRITAWGKTMRKWRLDELPQFWNILKGEMSIVGPRPERAYYVEQIRMVEPYYAQLFKVRPGLTSWGMVQFGYAENITEMRERLKYDLLYLENISLLVDLKILLHTLRIIFLGQGK